MIAEIKTEEILPVATRLTQNKVQPLQPVKSAQSLPEGGNELPPEQQQAPVNTQAVDEAVQHINEHVQFIQRELRFSVDEGSGHTVIKVLDTRTQEVIRQIPSEEALRFAQMLNEGSDIELVNTYI